MKTHIHTVRGSTLAETLVMMIVAGILFLSVMDGLRLFNIMLLRTTRAIETSGRTTENYRRMEALVAASDSVQLHGGILELYREEERTTLEVTDSALICRKGLFCDTLFRPVDRLQLVPGGETTADTVHVVFCAPAGRILLQFAGKSPVERQYGMSIEQIEEGYGYEE